MNRLITHGPPQPDPLEELRDEVETLRGELSTLQDTITANHEWLKDAVIGILQELESKSDRN
jgi:hypothetical protein